jgi:hypothetical protein
MVDCLRRKAERIFSRHIKKTWHERGDRQIVGTGNKYFGEFVPDALLSIFWKDAVYCLTIGFSGGKK